MIKKEKLKSHLKNKKKESVKFDINSVDFDSNCVVVSIFSTIDDEIVSYNYNRPQSIPDDLLTGEALGHVGDMLSNNKSLDDYIAIFIARSRKQYDDDLMNGHGLFTSD